VKNKAIVGRCGDTDKTLVVNAPLRPGASSRSGSRFLALAVHSSTRMCVSPLCSKSSWTASHSNCR
jgi:hypothetical protein